MKIWSGHRMDTEIYKGIKKDRHYGLLSNWALMLQFYANEREH